MVRFLFFFIVYALITSCDGNITLFGEEIVETSDSLLETTTNDNIRKNESNLPNRLLAASVTVIVYNKENNPIQFGSGVFVKPNIIATNFHVIEGGMFFKITRNSDKKLIDADIYKLLASTYLLTANKYEPKENVETCSCKICIEKEK